MVKYSEEALNRTFSALANPTRRAILARIAKEDITVTDLAEPFDEHSLPAISRHLRVLEKAGLLVQEKDGRIRRCRLVAEPLKMASDWVGQYQQFWEGQFDALAEFLQETLPEDEE